MHIDLAGAACIATKGNVGPIRPMSKLILVVIETLMRQLDHKIHRDGQEWYMSKERSRLGDDEL
jgi:hypothetical protein